MEENTLKNNLLAIVIPYFKIAFLEELLIALSCQTDKRFNVYIGSDNSTEDPEEIIKKYSDTLSIKYRKYTENLGHICPTHQWNRCLDLVGSEQWVWMLPDDDLVSINTVEEFYKSLTEVEENIINVVTIPSRIIDANSLPSSQLKINPKVQSVYQFYLRQLKGEATGSSLGDNIFRLSALRSAGGFVSFPRAWGSDHATILAASAKSNIYCLQNAWFGFRQSGINISSSKSDGDLKMKARLGFLEWLKQNENIFEVKPTVEFYKYFYWKSEYYMLHEWNDSLKIYTTLLKIRNKSINSINPLPLFKLFLRKNLN